MSVRPSAVKPMSRTTLSRHSRDRPNSAAARSQDALDRRPALVAAKQAAASFKGVPQLVGRHAEQRRQRGVRGGEVLALHRELTRQRRVALLTRAVALGEGEQAEAPASSKSVASERSPARMLAPPILRTSSPRSSSFGRPCSVAARSATPPANAGCASVRSSCVRAQRKSRKRGSSENAPHSCSGNAVVPPGSKSRASGSQLSSPPVRTMRIRDAGLWAHQNAISLPIQAERAASGEASSTRTSMPPGRARSRTTAPASLRGSSRRERRGSLAAGTTAWRSAEARLQRRARRPSTAWLYEMNAAKSSAPLVFRDRIGGSPRRPTQQCALRHTTPERGSAA